MAKKQDFRPDKPSISLLSRFMLTKKQQKTLFKWIFYSLFLVILSVVQDVLLSRVRLLGATTELIPCTIFLICLIEGSHTGSIFSLVAGLLYLFSGTAPGPYSMVAIVFFSIGACILRQAFLQESFSSVMLCAAGAMLAYVLTNFAFGLFLGLTRFSRIGGFFITAGLSLLSVPLFYPVVKAINAFGGQSWKE